MIEIEVYVCKDCARSTKDPMKAEMHMNTCSHEMVTENVWYVEWDGL